MMVCTAKIVQSTSQRNGEYICGISPCTAEVVLPSVLNILLWSYHFSKTTPETADFTRLLYKD